jgi:hypothetical protein
MSQKDYERYVREGPDSLSTSAMRAALDWRSEHPTEAFEVREAHERERRQREAEEVAKETWLRQGGDASQFRKAYDELTRDARKEALKRTEEERQAWHKRAARSF